MHGVVLHFKNKSKDEIEKIIHSLGIENEVYDSGDGYFFLRAYDDYEIEYEDDEKTIIERALEGKPEVSYLLDCRTKHSRTALSKVIEMFSQIPHAIMDDDNDGYWRYDQLKLFFSNPNANLYNLSDIAK